jgi:hypothetical protein
MILGHTCLRYLEVSPNIHCMKGCPSYPEFLVSVFIARLFLFSLLNLPTSMSVFPPFSLPIFLRSLCLLQEFLFVLILNTKTNSACTAFLHCVSLVLEASGRLETAFAARDILFTAWPLWISCTLVRLSRCSELTVCA